MSEMTDSRHRHLLSQTDDVVMIEATTPVQFKILSTLTPNPYALTPSAGVVSKLEKRRRGHRRKAELQALANSTALSAAAAGMVMEDYVGDLSNEKRKRKRPMEDEVMVEADRQEHLRRNAELAVVLYVDDLHKFYKSQEGGNRVRDYSYMQPQINARMRSVLINWLLKVQCEFTMRPETFYLSVNIIDRYLSLKFVTRQKLQLVGVCAMLIAIKYEEVHCPPRVSDVISWTDDKYSVQEALEMERDILK